MNKMAEIEPFPGRLEKQLHLGSQMYVLNDEQTKWLKKYYPNQYDRNLSKMMGCPATTVSRFAKELSINKNDASCRLHNKLSSYAKKWKK